MWQPFLFIKAYFSSSRSLLISFMCSTGNSGSARGRIAIDISFTGLSSAATRFELSFPQRLQRCIIAHSPFFLTHTPIASITAPQSDALSPGSSSTCLLERQFGQWLRWSEPAPLGGAYPAADLAGKCFGAGVISEIYSISFIMLHLGFPPFIHIFILMKKRTVKPNRHKKCTPFPMCR